MDRRGGNVQSSNRNGSELHGVRALVPSVTTAGFWRSKLLLEKLAERGIRATIIANSRTVESLCCEHQVDHVSTGTNLGFGRAINAAVLNEESWTFVLIINDDITLGSAAADALAESIRRTNTDTHTIVSYDPTSVARIPGAWSVFCRLSLLAAIAGRIRRNHPAPGGDQPRVLEPPLFAGFSIIGITNSAWSHLGGFDEGIPFYFEDADLTARFRGLPGGRIEVVPVGAQHERSSTARLFTRELCAVAAWSACVYLERRGLGHARARAIGITALLVRLLVVLAGGFSVSHAGGCLTAIRALARGVEPALPNYDQFV